MPLAIVSANAFDRRLDNDVGLPSEDFLVKPVRLSEMLDWLARQLDLSWVQGSAESTPDALAVTDVAPASPDAAPPPGALRLLREAVELGHPRGVLKALDALVASDPAHAAWAERIRALAREFRFEAIARLLDDGAHPTPSAQPAG